MVTRSTCVIFLKRVILTRPHTLTNEKNTIYTFIKYSRKRCHANKLENTVPCTSLHITILKLRCCKNYVYRNGLTIS